MVGLASTLTGGSSCSCYAPMKRSSLKISSDRSKGNVDGAKSKTGECTQFIEDVVFDPKISYPDSLSSLLGSTVATEEVESDSDVSESESEAEDVSMKPFKSDQPKKSDKKKKKKGRKSAKKTKKKSEKSEKKKKKDEKSRKSKKKHGSFKSPRKIMKEEISKEQLLNDIVEETVVEPIEHNSRNFYGAWDSRYVVPQVQNQLEMQEIPCNPSLWGDTEVENSIGEVWEEDIAWNVNDEEKNGEEYVEESLVDEGSIDCFSYYTIQSNDEASNDGFSYHTVLSDEELGFPEQEDIEDDLTKDWEEETDTEELSLGSRRVRFVKNNIVHKTLHICDFTLGEINRSWYHQEDYEDAIEDAKEMAYGFESPRKQFLSLSKRPENRGIEALTPSGSQRFRYVREASFRAVWDKQKKQVDRLHQSGEGDNSNSIDLTENMERLREAYQRVSVKSQKEAQERGKRDEEVAEKLRPRSGGLKWGRNRRGDLSRFKKFLGSSAITERRVLDGGSSPARTESPVAPSSCFRRTPKQFEENGGSGSTRSFTRVETYPQRTSLGIDRILFLKNGSLRRLARYETDPQRPLSDSILFRKKTIRGLLKQASDRSPLKKPQTERGLFQQLSKRSLFKSRGCSKPAYY